MIENIGEITLGQIGGWLSLAVGAILTIVEVTPKIKLNPWTWLLKAIGRGLNAEMLAEQRAIEETRKKDKAELVSKIEAMEKKVDDQEAAREEDRAENYRIQILRFGEELTRGIEHSKGHFDTILGNIKKYNAYCETHPDFENGVTEPTAEIIKETYHMLWMRGEFNESHHHSHSPKGDHHE